MPNQARIERIREALGMFPEGPPNGATYVQGSLPTDRARQQREALKGLGIRPVAWDATGVNVEATYAIPPGVCLTRQACVPTMR